ncbi:MAG: glycosyltransferase, partial [Candidatus Arcticimaribacter sp.]
QVRPVPLRVTGCLRESIRRGAVLLMASMDTIKSNLRIGAKDFVFCFVGRLVGDKGINELVHAFISLSQKYPQIKLVLVGEEEKSLDPLHPETSIQIKNHPHIYPVGYQHDIRPYLALSDIFVFPSYREGFPNVVLQASAMEVPSIVSNINGCNEIVRDQENGWWVPTKSTPVLIQKMEEACTDTSKRTMFKQQLRSEIIANYEREHFWGLLKQQYQSHLNHV